MSDDIEERPGGLAGAFLDMEDERQQSIADARDTGDDVMPGMGEGPMTLRQALRRGGAVTFTTLAAIVAVDNLEVATMSTLSPDIRDSLGLSDGAIIFIISASSAFLILGALPMGWLADRYRRGRIIGFSNLFFGLMTALTGIATSGVTLFFARLGVGSTKSNTFTVQSTLLADTYPITSRGRVGSMLSLCGSVTGTLSPLIVGGLATWIGGPSAWRWVFVLLSIPICIVSIFGFLLPEPPRGQFEKQDVLGEVIAEDDPLPISVEAAFARLLQIRTLKAVIIAFAAIGFGLFTVPILGNLFMEDEYGLGSFGRGAVGTVSGVAVMLTVPFVGKFYDGQYRKDPAKALRFVGWLVLPSALLVPVQYFMPNPVGFAILAVPDGGDDGRRVRDGRAVADLGDPVPAARDGTGARRAVHLLHRCHRWGLAGRSALERLRHPGGGHRAVRAGDGRRRRLADTECVVHPRRPAVGVARAARGAGRAPTPE